jgi:putative FmdB family regulatory protein
MPMYEYQCPVCGALDDKIYPMNNRPDTVEEDCHVCKEHVVKQYKISLAAIVSGVGGVRVDSTFKNRLEQLKKHYPDMRSSLV